jgi:hypothetical protein
VETDYLSGRGESSEKTPPPAGDTALQLFFASFSIQNSRYPFVRQWGCSLFRFVGCDIFSPPEVNTKKGRVVLMGDFRPLRFTACPKMAILDGMGGNEYPVHGSSPPSGPAVPHTGTYDLFAFHDGMSTIRAPASKYEPGYLLPGHEPSLVYSGV